MVGAADVGAVAGGRVRRVVARDGVDVPGRARLPLVPDVGAVRLERRGRASPGARGRPTTTAARTAWSSCRARPRADQPVEELGARLGLRRAADAEEAAAVLDERLSAASCSSSSRSPAVLRKTTARYAREVVGVERRGVAGRVDDEAVARRRSPRRRRCRAAWSGPAGRGRAGPSAARPGPARARRRRAPARAPARRRRASARSRGSPCPPACASATGVPLLLPPNIASPLSSPDWSCTSRTGHRPPRRSDHARSVDRAGRAAHAQVERGGDAAARARERAPDRPARPQRHRGPALVAAAHARCAASTRLPSPSRRAVRARDLSAEGAALDRLAARCAPRAGRAAAPRRWPPRARRARAPRTAPARRGVPVARAGAARPSNSADSVRKISVLPTRSRERKSTR